MSNSAETNSQLPALLDSPQDLAAALVSIKKDLEEINAHKHASPEFRALMDGYVNKANEAEFEKVKFKHMEEKYEELRAELRTLKELTKKQESDLDATREALKASESDLFKVKQEFNYYKDSADSKIHELSEDKRSQQQKVRDLLAEKEKNSTEVQNMQIKVMEANHRFKQLEQERGLDKDNYDRALRETENLVAELREQLDLRTRELEYKDALLNQLIKQVSEPNSMLSQTMAQSATRIVEPRQSMPQNEQINLRPLREPLPSEQAMADLPNHFAPRNLQNNPNSYATATNSAQQQASFRAVDASAKQQSSAMRWGAVRK